MDPMWRDAMRAWSRGWLPLRGLALVCLLATVGNVAVGAEPRQKLVGHTSPASFLAFSSDGKRLASSDTMRILLWDPETGKSQELSGPEWKDKFVAPRPGRFPAPPELWATFGVAFTDDDKTLVSFLGQMGPPFLLKRKIASWSVPDGRRGRDIVLKPTFGMAAATQLTVSPDGKTIAVAVAGPGAFLVVNRRTRRSITGFTPPGTNPLAMGFVFSAFSPDGKLLAITRNMNGRIEIWDVTRRRLKRKLTDVTPEVIRFSGDGKRLVTVGEGLIRCYDVSTGERLQSTEFSPVDGLHWPTRAAISSAATRVAFADPKSKQIRVYDVETGNLLGKIDGQRAVTTLTFSPDDKTLAVATSPAESAPFGVGPLDDARPDDEEANGGESPPSAEEPPADETASEPDGDQGGPGNGQGFFGTPGARSIPHGEFSDPENFAIELWDVPGIPRQSKQ